MATSSSRPWNPIRGAILPGLAAAALLALAACAGRATETTSPPSATPIPPPTRTPPPSATPAPTAAIPATGETSRAGVPLSNFAGDFFSASGACAICHTNLKTDKGEDVSLDSFWRATMMANAARDPYWQASVQAEINGFPDLADDIGDNCATCHMPMARTALASQGEPAPILGSGGLLDPEHPTSDLAMDGVSCSLCHQILETGLGGAATLSGDYKVDLETRKPERRIFGPYTSEGKLAALMNSASGFVPTKGPHLSSAGLCATCHILYTPALDADGTAVGEFPEQMIFFEWYYSGFRQERTCQDCHMPEVEGGVRISNLAEVMRSPFSRHSFVGGNAYMLRMLDTFGGELGVTASSEQFSQAIQRTRVQLQEHTAEVEIAEVAIFANRMIIDVDVRNQVGHKFPAGYPSRRAWLHLTVRDAAGGVVFESGGYDAQGIIHGNANDADATAFEPHYDTISDAGQVQIYEAILEDTEGQVTTRLLRALGYRKDNRLLPAGFEKSAPYEDIAVRGDAFVDEDFVDGSDRITYRVDLGGATGPYTVEVELVYQSIGHRWAEKLRNEAGDLAARFLRFYDEVPNTPERISRASLEATR